MIICARKVECADTCVLRGTLSSCHVLPVNVVHVCCAPPPSCVPPSPHNARHTPAGSPLADRSNVENEKLCPATVPRFTSCQSEATPPPPREPVFICRKYWPSCAVPSW